MTKEEQMTELQVELSKTILAISKLGIEHQGKTELGMSVDGKMFFLDLRWINIGRLTDYFPVKHLYKTTAT